LPSSKYNSPIFNVPKNPYKKENPNNNKQEVTEPIIKYCKPDSIDNLFLLLKETSK